MAINVVVSYAPGVPVSVILNGDHSVAKALEISGLSHEGYEVRVDNDVVPLDFELEEGDRVLLYKKIKGNA